MPSFIRDLPQVNAVSNSDLLIVETNPNSTPNTKTIQVANFFNNTVTVISYTANVTNANTVTVHQKLGEAISIKDFGAVGDGVANDTPAFQAAAALGIPIKVPMPPVRWRLSGQVNLYDGTIFYGEGGYPEIIMDTGSTSRMFDSASKTRCGLRKLKINGNKNITPVGTLIRFRDSTYVEVTDCELIDTPGDSTGALVFSGNTTHSRIINVRSIDAEGTHIGLTGNGVYYNTVDQCEFIGGGSFGIRLGEGASHNRISNTRAVNTGKEGIATTWSCKYNVITNNYITGAGDNGISISGSYSTAAGNICYKNYRAGIGIWGEYNSITGNVCTSNNQENTNIWAGVWIGNGYGGTGQNNTITGNTFDDDQSVLTQYWNVRISGNSYTVWSSGIAVTTNSYYYYGLNVYQAQNSGTTGNTPPTHTSGTISDDVISWKYLNTARNFMTSRLNFVAINHPGRNLSTQNMSDASNWVNNELFGYGSNKRFGAFPSSNTGLQSSEWWVDSAAGNSIKINS